jgi:MiaB/RimO family radical SAM methylthiotransferase
MLEKSVFVLSNGCPECIMDANLLEKVFCDKHSYAISEDYRNANYIFFLGCCVTQGKEDHSYNIINHINKFRHPNSELVVSGCIAKLKPELATTFEKTSLSPEELNDISICREIDREIDNELTVHSPFRSVGKKIIKDMAGERFQPFDRLTNFFSDFLIDRIRDFNTNTACIKIATGCLRNCSYCSIKMTRGKVKSKPIEKVMNEFQILIDQGFTDFSLMGTNIGDYGKDRKTNLLDLLESILRIRGDFHLRLRNLHPTWFIENFSNFFQLLGSGKIQYILSPLQSGNDRILKLMNRGHRAKDLIDCFTRIKQAYPSIVLSTEMIVGFPTETKEEFLESLQLFDRAIIDAARIFHYTERPGTRASRIENKLSEDVIMDRHRKMRLKYLFRRPLQKARAIYHLNRL